MDSLLQSAQSHMVDLPAGRFHYLSWGAERSEHPSVLLLHGITSSAGSWVRVGPALADRYRVYALDMRGHGMSPKPSAGAYSLRQTADDAAALLEVLGLERPVLIGHSWGGATAIVLASGLDSEKPAPNFSHIVLEDPAHAFNVSRASYYTRDIGRPAQELRPEITAENPGWTSDDIEGKIEALQQVTREAVESVFAEAPAAGVPLPLLARLSGPTLLVRADATLGSTLNAADWEQARLSLPPANALEIAGATHNVHRSKFEEFMQAVNAFLLTRTA